MGYETILTQVDGRVASIRFHRPEALNALNSQVMHEVVSAAKAFDADPDIGAILLMGDARAFAAGADIKELMQHDYASMQAENYFAPWDEFAALRTPKIAVVRGYALGGGCEVAMMCDLLLASDSAKFGQPEIKIGCIPGIGGTQRLTRLIGKAAAMDMILTGRMISAEEALRLGLTSRVIPDDQIEAEARKTAQTIAGYAKEIAIMARNCVLESERAPLDAGIRYERQTYHALYGSQAQREGMQAFVEKRPPAFRKTAQPAQ
ncbi:MAG: enoyl-CoA hydratase-related protein [Mangrovicoccus sp.]|nr:enoyl-CoA hydratase-related protein [Mangrovicoccus sp.]